MRLNISGRHSAEFSSDLPEAKEGRKQLDRPLGQFVKPYVDIASSSRRVTARQVPRDALRGTWSEPVNEPST